jgi:alpha-ribazole phosphatase
VVDLPEVTRILTSPMKRAARLAEGLARARGLDLSTDARLAEMDFGAWEGRRWDDIPRAELDAWAADLLNARPHGGESVAMMAARAAEALDDCAGALVVTHMGIIKAALARAGHADPWNAKVRFAEVVTL